MFFSGEISLPEFVSVFLGVALLLYIFHQGRAEIFNYYVPQQESIQESVNLLEGNLKKKNEILRELPQKAQRVFTLSKVIDSFTSLVEEDKIYEFFITSLKHFFSGADGILLFIFDPKENTLELTRSLKRKAIVIKEKKGDIIDWWVLRHNQSLIIENTTEDFRFDFFKSYAFKERGIHSFIISPISLGDKVVGVARIESVKKRAFSLDDLRILRIFCDVGASVLERASIFRQIKELATKDALTDLFLKNVFFQRIKEELKRARFNKTKLALGIVDIDDFKKINDTHGHAVGDMVLKQTAQILVNVIGNSGNMISRFGGEEFVFFVVRVDNKSAKEIARRIVQEIKQNPVTFRRKTIRCTASLGMVMYPDDAREYLELMEKADKLLYRAKEEGKDRVCLSF